VRLHAVRKSAAGDLRSRVERLAHLPIRPATARQVLGSFPDEPIEAGSLPPDWPKMAAIREIDPGWVLAEAAAPALPDPLELLAALPWWPAVSASAGHAEAIQRLWRHSVAVSIAARWIAKESDDPVPDRLVRAGLLHGLGRWAVAAVDPDWIARWLAEGDPRTRRQREIADLGSDLCEIGRRLAERWGCDPLIVEAAWLHADASETLARLATEIDRLPAIQRAYRWAESTPWALVPTPERDILPAEPRLRILTAEVQSRCGSLFASADATSHEEKVTRRAAQQMLQLGESRRMNATYDRFLRALATTDPGESPEGWADRVGVHWCAEPEVNAARVVWKGLNAAAPTKPADEETPVDPGAPGPEAPSDNPPTLVLPLKVRGRPGAEVHLWCGAASTELKARLDASGMLLAWEAWASLLHERSVLERRLQALVFAVRGEFGDHEARSREAKLDALAEFAAGAGHELNNPLAVIVGRAQLLLGRADDPDTVRSLKIILAQAQRTHRILRDLMFVARTPTPRPRACRPSEILRACAAGLQEECESRQIRLVSEIDAGETQSWTDPDALGHLAEVLLRNAIQATPPGGRIQVRCTRQGDELRWTFADSGKGIGPCEGPHLFDPFYCGRQAGRGLGLGLPRAARIVALAGGSMEWASTLGQGTTFHVHLPVIEPPDDVTAGTQPTRGPLASPASPPMN
jgi:signal transduction histidine kinase